MRWAVIAVMLFVPSGAIAQTDGAKPIPQDRWHDRDGQPTAQPYPLPMLSGEADPVAAQARDGRVIILVVDRNRTSTKRPVIEAWEDPRVQAWLSAHAHAFIVTSDVLNRMDERVDAALSPFGGKRPAGLFAVRDAKIVDHDLGFVSAASLLEWLRLVEVESARVPADYALRRVREITVETPIPPRLVAAERLERLALRREAADVLVSAIEVYFSSEYDRKRTANLGGESGYELSEMDFPEHSAEMAMEEGSPEVRARLTALRDGAIRGALVNLQDPKDQPARSEKGRQFRNACRLVSLVPDRDASRAFFESVRADAIFSKYPKAVADLERAVDEPALKAQQRGNWALAGSLIVDPEAAVRVRMSLLGFGALMARLSDAPTKGTPTSSREKDLEIGLAGGDVYASLLAASREENATAALKVIVSIRSSADVREGILVACSKAKQARRAHREWLTEIKEAAKREGRDDPAVVAEIERLLEATGDH